MIPKKREPHMSNDARIAVLETTILNINSTLNRIDTRLDAMDKKFEAKFDALDKKFDTKLDSLNNRLWSNFLWLMGMIIGLAGLIAHTQHWL